MLSHNHQNDIGGSSQVAGLSAKLIYSEHSDRILECFMLREGDSAFSLPAFVNPEDLDFVKSYPNESLDEPGILSWLVEQEYLPQTALYTRYPFDILHDLNMDRSKPKAHDRSRVDYSYHPEYDAFLADMKQLVEE